MISAAVEWKEEMKVEVLPQFSSMYFSNNIKLFSGNNIFNYEQLINKIIYGHENFLLVIVFSFSIGG